jgi:hypothetical protein
MCRFTLSPGTQPTGTPALRPGQTSRHERRRTRFARPAWKSARGSASVRAHAPARGDLRDSRWADVRTRFQLPAVLTTQANRALPSEVPTPPPGRIGPTSSRLSEEESLRERLRCPQRTDRRTPRRQSQPTSGTPRAWREACSDPARHRSLLLRCPLIARASTTRSATPSVRASISDPGFHIPGWLR